MKVPSPSTRRLEWAARGECRPSLGPQSVGIVLTNACNLTCITCWSYSPLRTERPPVEWMRRHLTRRQLSPLFDELAAMGTERVIFSGGGEPLAHTEAYEIVEDAKRAGLKVTLISNVTLARDADRFAALGVDTLMANFSSGDAPSYVAFHPGRTVDDFGRIVDVLDAVAATRTEIKLVFVVCSVNAEALPLVFDWARRWRASVQCKLVSTTPATAATALRDEQRAQLIDRWPAIQSAARGVVHNLSVLYSQLLGQAEQRTPIDDVGCHAGTHYARIHANGDVLYCCNPHRDLVMGSIHDGGFRRLWIGERWAAARARLAAGDFVAGCDQCGKLDLNTRVAARLRSATRV